ncbi:MAG: YggS family pyridoxal phosphate-dependent enzyme [Hyphomicrobiales bacterium]
MTSHTASGIAERLAAVRRRVEQACARAGRDPASVTIVGASKTHRAGVIVEAWRAGLRVFGENRVQEGLAKIAGVREIVGPDSPGPEWHFIGHLQTNKAKAAAGAFAILHGVDSARLFDTLAATGQPVRTMIEVNVAREASKHGILPEELGALIAHARRLPGVTVEGLMTVAPQSANPEDARPVFRQLRELAREHNLPCLSMGMTEDFEVAIEEGATHVRIGRALFGERE